MYEIFLIAAAVLVGGVCWRGRGGWFDIARWTDKGSTTISRVLGVVPLTPFGYALADWQGAVAAVLLLPTLTFGWAQWQVMTNAKDLEPLIGMTGRGCFQVLLTCTALTYLVGNGEAASWYQWAGALMGPIYWTAWRLEAVIRPVRILGRDFIDGPTSVAEITFGMMLYGGFTAALLYA